jgi:hypothetical protein
MLDVFRGEEFGKLLLTSLNDHAERMPSRGTERNLDSGIEDAKTTLFVAPL